MGIENPFVYSKPLPPADLIDREEECAQVLDLLRGGHNCRLSAPRRYGKTSLLHKLRSDAENEGLPSVYVNFYGILSVAEAVARLERGYRDLRGPIGRWMAAKLEGLSVSLQTPVATVGASASRSGAPERALHELLDLPRQMFSRTGVRVLVCFDEFQEVLSTRIALDGAIRSAIEQHRDEAAYVFAGSHRGMMRALFDDRERPFYGQARSITIGPLGVEDIAAYVGSRFEQTGREIGSALRPLLAAARGHPQRTMMLAHFLWEATPTGDEADDATFPAALGRVMDELSEAFDRTWRGLQDGERRTLLAIVVSEGQPTHAPALRAADVPRTTVNEALVRLSDAGYAVEVSSRWQLVDPLLAIWIAQRRGDT